MIKGREMSLRVAPEIEAKVREEAAARGVSVDTVINQALRLLQKHRDLPAVRPVHPHKDRSREMAWVASPDLQYVNQWVALDGDQVVAHGTDGKLVFETARSKGFETPFMEFVEEPDSTPFAGGWL